MLKRTTAALGFGLVFVAFLFQGTGQAASLAPPPAAHEAPASTKTAPTVSSVLELANGTGFAHPAIGTQGGRAQFLVLLFNAEVPATNSKEVPTNAPTRTAGNEGVNVSDEPAGTADAVDTTTTREELWNLRDQLDSVVSGSRGQGADNGTAETLSKVEARLLSVERAQLQELLGILENGDAQSAAYVHAIEKLTALRDRLTRLSRSNTTAVADGTKSLVGDLDPALERALTARSEHLLDVLQSSASSAASKAAAAAELIDVRNRLSTLPTAGRNAGPIDLRLDEYFKSRVEALTAVLDDADATAAAKTTALNELRSLRNTLLEYAGDDTAGPSPSAELLGEIENRLVARIRGRLDELGTIVGDSSSTSAAKAEALTEMFNLWDELRGLTFGLTARRNEGDTSHDDLIGDLGNRITIEIGQRYTELATSLTEDASGAELGAAADELFESWQRLRTLGKTDTTLYENLESTVREVYRVQSIGLTDTLNDDSASDAERAAAASALDNINNHLETLDSTHPAQGGNPYEDPTRFENNERLGEYVRDRIGRLGAVLDSSTATAEDKEAAINELRQLRTMLINMGRRPASSTGGMRGDSDIDNIDRRLQPLAQARLNELARTLESATATAAEKQTALHSLEELRGVFRELGDETGETETRIDKLLNQGLNERLEQLNEDLEGGAGSSTPITGGFRRGDGTRAVDLSENPTTVASSLLDFQRFGLPGGPTLAVLARSTGVSTGPGSMDFLVANAAGAANLSGDGLVVEPLTEEPERIEEIWAALVERANAVVSVNPEGYCLEKEQRPPSPGELYTLASAGKQSQFSSARSILRAGGQLYESGHLNPEVQSDPEQYFHSIRQWAIWTHEHGYDEAGFTETFVGHTRTNIEARDLTWTPEIEALVSGLAPNRWRDISNVLTAAGFAAP